MAKAEVSRVRKGNFVVNYLRETRAELRKVHWPTQEEARTLTLVVVAVTVAMAVLLGLSDFVFDRLLTGIVTLNPLAIIVTVVLVVALFVAGFVITRE